MRRACVYEGTRGGGGILYWRREEALSLLTVISTRAEDRRLSAPTEAPKPIGMTEDWAKCALKSIYVPYGAPASEKKKERASETPTRCIIT